MSTKSIKHHNGKQFLGQAKEINVPSKVQGVKSGIKRDVAVQARKAKGSK